MFQNYPFSTGQKSVTSAATLIVAANPDRSGLVITNTSASTAIYVLENASGTTGTGHYLAGGASLGFTTTGAVYGISSGSTVTVTFLQTQ